MKLKIKTRIYKVKKALRNFKRICLIVMATKIENY